MTPACTATPTNPPKRARERSRGQRAALQHEDGPLQLARTSLAAAVFAMTARQPHRGPNGTTWLDSRYIQLRQALYTHHGGNGGNQKSTLIPGWTDALKILIDIDVRTAQHVAAWESQLASNTPERLHQLLDRQWRPQDSKAVTTIANDVAGWAKEIDDLLWTKISLLYDPDQPNTWATCPHCQRNEARRVNDEGQRVRTAALAVIIDYRLDPPTATAFCQNCHDTFESPQFLGRLLGCKAPEGVTA